MANLQVRDIDNNLYNSLKQLARNEKRTISQEVVLILEKYLSAPKDFSVNPTDKFLELSGSWYDDRSSDEIIDDIRSSRTANSRFGDNNELFD